MGKFHLCPAMVLGCFVYRFNSWNGFRLFYCPFYTSLNTDPLDTRGEAASVCNVIETILGHYNGDCLMTPQINLSHPPFIKPFSHLQF